jgi:hypothetical protein
MVAGRPIEKYKSKVKPSIHQLIQTYSKIQCFGSLSFLGSLGLDPVVEGPDLNPDPYIIMQKLKKNVYFYCFVTSL